MRATGQGVRTSRIGSANASLKSSKTSLIAFATSSARPAIGPLTQKRFGLSCSCMFRMAPPRRAAPRHDDGCETY
eukprot:3455458-Prymnesium_polylepis.1